MLVSPCKFVRVILLYALMADKKQTTHKGYTVGIC